MKLTLPESGGIILVWLAMLMLPQAPLTNRYIASIVIAFILLTVISRNLYLIAGAAVVFNLIFRWGFQISHWHDMHWGQWYSISALISGHNLYAPSPLVGMSLANYMPLGNLYGGLLIAMGVQDYWNVWHVLVVALLLIPFLLRPSAQSLILFIASASFYPLVDYTTGGGTLEIGLALTIAAIALYRRGMVEAALILFAYAAMFRQTSAMLAPFVLLLLWREKQYRRIALFGGLLLLFGGVFILGDLPDAYESMYRIWAPYADQWYNAYNGLNGNYTIASIPHLFGVSDAVAWNQWGRIYTPVMLAGIAAVFFAAFKSKSRDTILALGVLATVFVYLLARGYAQFHYVVGTAFPFLAFFYPTAGTPPTRLLRINVSRLYVECVCAILFLFAVAPLAVFALGKTEYLVNGMRAMDPPVSVAKTARTPKAGQPEAIPNLDGAGRTFKLTDDVEFDFAQPVRLSAVRLSGEHTPVQNVRGVPMLYATETEMRGAVTRGEIECSEDGSSFAPCKEFHEAASYSVYPVLIRLPADRAVKAVRIHPQAVYLDHPEWLLGKVEFFGH